MKPNFFPIFCLLLLPIWILGQGDEAAILLKVAGIDEDRNLQLVVSTWKMDSTQHRAEGVYAGAKPMAYREYVHDSLSQSVVKYYFNEVGELIYAYKSVWKPKCEDTTKSCMEEIRIFFVNKTPINALGKEKRIAIAKGEKLYTVLARKKGKRLAADKVPENASYDSCYQDALRIGRSIRDFEGVQVRDLGENKVRITLREATLKSLPDLNAEILAVLKEGETLILTGEKGGRPVTAIADNREFKDVFYRVRTASGATGWVHGIAINSF